MSRERARRREERLAESARRAEEARLRAERQAEIARRRRRRRAAVRALLPWRPGQRWSRRTRTQRGAVAGVLLAVFVMTWLVTDTWSVRIACMLAAVLVTPAVVTLFLDRSTR